MDKQRWMCNTAACYIGKAARYFKLLKNIKLCGSNLQPTYCTKLEHVGSVISVSSITSLYQPRCTDIIIHFYCFNVLHLLCYTGYPSSLQMTDQYPSTVYQITDTHVLPMNTVMPSAAYAGNELHHFLRPLSVLVDMYCYCVIHLQQSQCWDLVVCHLFLQMS